VCLSLYPVVSCGSITFLPPPEDKALQGAILEAEKMFLPVLLVMMDFPDSKTVRKLLFHINYLVSDILVYYHKMIGQSFISLDTFYSILPSFFQLTNSSEYLLWCQALFGLHGNINEQNITTPVLKEAYYVGPYVPFQALCLVF
jgi:hypothetical protein